MHKPTTPHNPVKQVVATVQLAVSPALSAANPLSVASSKHSVLTVSGDLAASPPAAFAASIAVTVPASHAMKLYLGTQAAKNMVTDHGLQILKDLTCRQGHGVRIHAGGESFPACKGTNAACLPFIADCSAKGLGMPLW